MKILLSHPTGNANFRAVADSLLNAKMLYGLETCIACTPGSMLNRLSSFRFFAEISRRRYDVDYKNLIGLWPWFEASRLLASKLNLKKLTKHETGIFSTDAVFKNFDEHVATKLKAAAKNGAGGVYAYEDAAHKTFSTARKLGMKCIYDLPIAYWETGRKLMNEEAERLPEWAATLGGGIADSPQKLQRKTEELEFADMVSVPGSFVFDSLPQWARSKEIIISPFGTPEMPTNNPKILSSSSKKKSEKLKVLFVGSMGQRKGLGDLFKAVKLLNRPEVELIVMGSLLAPIEFYKQQYANFTYEPGRSHKQVLELMGSCDVFCLPSIVEGRALVMQEAMSQGLPIIITPNTGGADLVIEGETGFLVPIQSPEAIAEKIVWFLENRSMLPLMGKKAQAHAYSYTWKNYGLKIVQSINQHFH